MSKLDHIKIGDTDYEVQDSELTSKVASLETSVTAVQTEVENKQDKLTAGDNITITNNVISATGGGSSGGTKLYLHTLSFTYKHSSFTYNSFTLTVITTYSTPITASNIASMLNTSVSAIIYAHST